MNKETFISKLKELNIILSEKDLNKFEKFKELLQEYNKKFNLTSIINDEEIYLKHFYDSLYLFKIPEINTSTTILDIGTGAGFPGIPLGIINPKLKITLVESNGKKCNFLNLVKKELNLSNIEVINSRAEDFVKTNRNKFDIATSRAVAHLSILAELEIPSLKVNGLFLPLKSNIDEEIEETKNKLKDLNSNIEEIIEYTLPIEDSKRTILKIRKIKETDTKYPREYNKIKKSLETNRK